MIFTKKYWINWDESTFLSNISKWRENKTPIHFARILASLALWTMQHKIYITFQRWKFKLFYIHIHDPLRNPYKSPALIEIARKTLPRSTLYDSKEFKRGTRFTSSFELINWEWRAPWTRPCSSNLSVKLWITRYQRFIS